MMGFLCAFVSLWFMPEITLLLHLFRSQALPPNNPELLNAFAFIGLADVRIAFRIDGDAVSVSELTGKMTCATAEARENSAGIAIEDVDLRIILIGDE